MSGRGDIRDFHPIGPHDGCDAGAAFAAGLAAACATKRFRREAVDYAIAVARAEHDRARVAERKLSALEQQLHQEQVRARDAREDAERRLSLARSDADVGMGWREALAAVVEDLTTRLERATRANGNAALETAQARKEARGAEAARRQVQALDAAVEALLAAFANVTLDASKPAHGAKIAAVAQAKAAQATLEHGDVMQPVPARAGEPS